MTSRSLPSSRWIARVPAVMLVAIWVGAWLGCSNDTATRRALLESGFTDIVTTGWAFGGCSDSDGTCTGFRATGPSGIRVEGYVGCGYFFKGCTVRVK